MKPEVNLPREILPRQNDFSRVKACSVTTANIYIKQSQHQKPYENRGLVEGGV